MFFTNHEDYTKITLKKHKQQKKRSNKKRPIFQNYLKKPTKIKPKKKQQNAKKKKHTFLKKNNTQAKKNEKKIHPILLSKKNKTRNNF